MFHHPQIYYVIIIFLAFLLFGAYYIHECILRIPKDRINLTASCLLKPSEISFYISHQFENNFDRQDCLSKIFEIEIGSRQLLLSNEGIKMRVSEWLKNNSEAMEQAKIQKIITVINKWTHVMTAFNSLR